MYARRFQLFAVAVGCALIGCTMAVSAEWARGRTVGHVPCGSGEIQIEGQPIGDGLGNVDWTAICSGRRWTCAQRSMGHDVYTTSCTETAESEARTTREVVLDRLALETGCPAERIRIDEQAAWSRGGEAAYRATACERSFVCTSGPRGTDCEPASETEATTPTPAASSSLGQDEAMAVLHAAEAEVLACIPAGEDAPETVALELQVNGDGTAIYLGATPSPPAEVARCLRELVSSLRFRATGGEPLRLETPPLTVSSQ